MILNCSNGDVWTSGLEEKKFGFSNSPIIFKILSDSLYSDKEASIIRELSSNAIDAHKAAGTPDIPFEITISESSLFYAGSHSLSIKDKGIGLSEEEVYNIYSVYGNSLKRETNDFIGGFGLGSKSPFAYTETFTVSSIHDGVQKVYTAYIGSDGYPVIAKMYEKKTDEHNGLEVIIPIKRDDISKFSHAVSTQLSYVNPRPICTGFAPKWQNGKSIYKKNDWEICQNLYRGSWHWYVEIGGFYYIIGDFSNLFVGATNSFHSMKHDVVLHMGIGDIDLSASREAIAYTQKTVEVLKERLKKFSIEAYQSFVEYAKEHSKFDTYYFATHTLPVICFSELLNRFHQNEYAELKATNYTREYTSYNPFLAYKKNIHHSNFYSGYSAPYIESSKFSWNSVRNCYEYILIPTRIIFIKAPSPNLKKIGEHMRTNGVAEAILIRGVEYGSTAYYEILELLGNPSTVEVMEIEVPKKEKPQKEVGLYNYRLDTCGQLYIPNVFDYCECQGHRNSDKLHTIFEEEKDKVKIFIPVNSIKIAPYEDCPSKLEMYHFFKLTNFIMRSFCNFEKLQIVYFQKTAWKAAVKAGYDLSYEAMLKKLKDYCARNSGWMLDKESANVLMEVSADCPRLLYLVEEAKEYRFSDNKFPVLQKLVSAIKSYHSKERTYITLYANLFGYEGERTFDWKGYYNDNPILEILGTSGMSDEHIKLCLRKYLTM